MPADRPDEPLETVLARGLESRTEYKQMMDLADAPRQDDLDGRGNLSERALIQLVSWFLRVALDQISFMSELFDLDNPANRLRAFIAHHARFEPEAAALLEEALIRGEFERGEASRITGLPVRTAQRLLNDLAAEGVLAAATPKGPVSLRFPRTVSRCCSLACILSRSHGHRIGRWLSSGRRTLPARHPPHA